MLIFFVSGIIFAVIIYELIIVPIRIKRVEADAITKGITSGVNLQAEVGWIKKPLKKKKS